MFLISEVVFASLYFISDQVRSGSSAYLLVISLVMAVSRFMLY